MNQGLRLPGIRIGGGPENKAHPSPLLQVWTRTGPRKSRRPPESLTMYACYCRAPGETSGLYCSTSPTPTSPLPFCCCPLSRPITSAAGLATCAAVSAARGNTTASPPPARPLSSRRPFGLPTGLRRGPPAVPALRLPGAIAAPAATAQAAVESGAAVVGRRHRAGRAAVGPRRARAWPGASSCRTPCAGSCAECTAAIPAHQRARHLPRRRVPAAGLAAPARAREPSRGSPVAAGQQRQRGQQSRGGSGERGRRQKRKA